MSVKRYRVYESVLNIDSYYFSNITEYDRYSSGTLRLVTIIPSIIFDEKILTIQSILGFEFNISMLKSLTTEKQKTVKFYELLSEASKLLYENNPLR